MKKVIIIIAGIIVTAASCYSQSNLDSAICKYLVESRQMEKPVNNVTKAGGKLVKNTNYFLEKKPVIRLSNSSTLQPVIFGCYKSHANRYLLVRMEVNSKSSFYFYGSNKLLDEVEKLKVELIETLNFSLNDEALARLINCLSSCYL